MWVTRHDPFNMFKPKMDMVNLLNLTQGDLLIQHEPLDIFNQFQPEFIIYIYI
jgi:hypothetical protein